MQGIIFRFRTADMQADWGSSRYSILGSWQANWGYGRYIGDLARRLGIWQADWDMKGILGIWQGDWGSGRQFGIVGHSRAN